MKIFTHYIYAVLVNLKFNPSLTYTIQRKLDFPQSLPHLNSNLARPEKKERVNKLSGGPPPSLPPLSGNIPQKEKMTGGMRSTSAAAVALNFLRQAASLN